MGLKSWWAGSKERASQNRQQQSFANPQLIASQVPELTGMSFVDGAAHTLEETEAWRQTASEQEWAEVQRRQLETIATFEAEGVVMPYWGNLWLLRTYQRELGLDVPWVAPANKSKD